MITDRGLDSQIRIAAITYDPGFDTPARMVQYGHSRGFHTHVEHRMLRTVDGLKRIRSHFQLGVNFVGSLVNRHRVEVYILDRTGVIAWTFQRLHWKEEDVVARAIALLEKRSQHTESKGKTLSSLRLIVSPGISAIAYFAFALFPKCPICWATYMSFLGLSWSQKIQHLVYLQLLFALLIVVNVGTVWIRSRLSHQIGSFALVMAGALLLIFTRVGQFSAIPVAVFGVILTASGSLISVYSRHTESRPLRRPHCS